MSKNESTSEELFVIKQGKIIALNIFIRKRKNKITTYHYYFLYPLFEKVLVSMDGQTQEINQIHMDGGRGHKIEGRQTNTWTYTKEIAGQRSHFLFLFHPRWNLQD